MTLFYLPLEAYPERYTWQLQQWTENALKKRGIKFYVVAGERLPHSQYIETGVALDAHGRSYYALTQWATVVKLLRDNAIQDGDIIYSQDMWAAGFEALPYILYQTKQAIRFYSHCLAQSIDPHDFTFPMRHWMRHSEMLIDKNSAGLFLASSVQENMLRTALFESPLHVVGLPFDADEVRGRYKMDLLPLHKRPKQIIYSSRFDEEKQPHFFMDFAERFKSQFPDYQILICTGQPQLRSNVTSALNRTRDLERRGVITIHQNLSKDEYYFILANSRLHVNTALQDFVSNTLLEASTFGTPTLAPSYLAFPEALFNNPRQLFVTWSLDDMVDKAWRLLENPPLQQEIERPSQYHSQTLDRVLGVIYGD